MNSSAQSIPRFLFKSETIFVISITIWLLLYQTVLRGLFVYTHYDLTKDIPLAVLATAFGIGVRFDLMITGIAILPLVLGLLFPATRYKRDKFRIWLTVFFSLVTFLAVLELDFYKEFHQRLNSLVFEYMKEDPQTVLSMIWFGFPVIRYMLLIGALIFSFHKIVFFIDQKTQRIDTGGVKSIRHHVMRSAVFLIALLLTVVACRGTLRQGPPLRWGDAFFSEFTFANHLGLNGTFTLAKAGTALANKKDDNSFWLKGMSPDTATDLVRKGWLTPYDQLIDADTAALRRITTPPTTAAAPAKIKNVVIILMESFSGEYVGALGDTHGVTPAFDALAEQGLLFERFFSNGTHTHQGMFATLACFPNLPGHEYLMYQPEGAHTFSGIAKLLPAKNYNQTYVYNGSFTWDNQEGFFKNQGMTKFVGREQYINPKFSDPTWGVSDEDMFDRALLELEQMPKDKPFYAVLQTLSNHMPYSLPEPLPMEKIMVRRQFSERLTAMRYSDYMLGKFFEQAQKSDYYRDTLFVVLGDHGFSVDKQLTALDLLRFHVPLLLIGPGIVEQHGHISTRVATQVDLIPTIMSLLGQPYQHQCWGRDVLNLPEDDQGLIVIKPSGNDPVVAIISGDNILVRDPNDSRDLYKYSFYPESAVTPHDDAETAETLWQLMQAYVQTALISLREDNTAP